MHPLPMSKPPRSLSPNTAQALKTAGLVRHLGSVAEGIGVRFVVLKGAALHALSFVKANARPMCDLDVLLSPEGAARLNDTLVSQGWEARGGPCGEDHLPVLKHPFWPALELHDQLNGVSRDGKSWVRFADLVNGGGVEAFPAGGSAVFVPTREFLAAHAIAHGFFHHNSIGVGYQLHRVFDDLAALGVLEGTDDGFLAGPGRWMKRGLAREEILTILCLGRRLARSENVAADIPPTPESRLLEHVTRSEGDPLYRDALRLRTFQLLGGTGHNRLRTFLGNSWHLTFLSRGQVDAIYGRPKHEWVYPVRQVLRPFDLALRVARYSVAWLKLRARGESPPSAPRCQAP